MKNWHRKKTLLSFFFVFVFSIFFIHIPLSNAQFQRLGSDVAHIELTPTYPEAEKPFTARLADYTNALGSGKLTWYVDGVLQKDKGDASSITLTAPRMGTPMVVEARRESMTRSHTSVDMRFVPGSIDIITEGDTKVPYFYEGRKIPALGTNVRLIAIPHLYDAKGREIPSSKITYTWNVDNVNVSIGGGPILETKISEMGSPLVLLTANAPEYQMHYETVFTMETAEPTLQFYALNPLTGLSRNALQDAYLHAKDEVTVRAETYGIANNIYDNAKYGWNINGTDVTNGNNDPELVTLRKQGGGGASDVSFSVRNLAALSQYAYGLFRLEF